MSVQTRDYNEQLADPERMERTLTRLREFDVPSAVDGTFDELMGHLEDVIYEDPDFGTTCNLRTIRTQADRVKEHLDGQVPGHSGLTKAVDGAYRAASDELSRYPAQGSRRHYSLDLQLKNL